MKTLDTEKIVQKFSELCEKRDNHIEAAKTDAERYAEAHGFDEEKTSSFVAFVSNIEGDGLTENERDFIRVLSEFENKEQEISESYTCNSVEI